MKYLKHSHKSGDKIIPKATSSKIESTLENCHRPLRIVHEITSRFVYGLA